jgi:hypothetical protein
MSETRKTGAKFRHALTAAVLSLAVLLGGSSAWGHGPGGHTEGFTSLQAVQKGLELYDRLVELGKLSEAWETDLVNIEITRRDSGGQKEFVVKFTCSAAATTPVTIFLSEKGEYVGSELAEK